MSDRLIPGQQLNPNDKLLSANGRYELIMQTDGNLVLYPQPSGSAVWASNTWNTPVTHAIMQTDGNLVCYDPAGKAHWSTDTWDHAGAFAVLENDGSLVIFGPSGSGLWASDLCLPNVPWQNYPKNLPAVMPAFTCVPATVDDISAIIVRAEKEGKRVHARGGGWSFSDCAETTDYLITTSQLNAPLQTVQKALHPGSPTVYHVQAGITIHDLYLSLSHLGLALETMGGSSGQTLAGAVSTGTHGGDRFGLSGLADSVVALHMVGTGGTQYWIEPEPGITDPALLRQFVCPGVAPANVMYDTATFDACLVSLGCMGVVYAVVLRVRPQYDLIENTIATTWTDFQRAAPSYLNDPDKRFLQVAVSPYPDSRGASNVCLVTTRSEAPGTSPLNGTQGRGTNSTGVTNAVTNMINAMGIVNDLKLELSGAFGNSSMSTDRRFVSLSVLCRAF